MLYREWVHLLDLQAAVGLCREQVRDGVSMDFHDTHGHAHISDAAVALSQPGSTCKASAYGYVHGQGMSPGPFGMS